MFELNPEQYLYTGSQTICFFVVHKCKLPGDNANLFLVGDVFLRHFYSVYDFDKNQLSLGINMHSKGRVSLHKPGERPSDSQNAETSQQGTDKDDEDVEISSSSGQTTTNKIKESSATKSRSDAAQKSSQSHHSSDDTEIIDMEMANTPTDLDELMIQQKLRMNIDRIR